MSSAKSASCQLPLRAALVGIISCAVQVSSCSSDGSKSKRKSPSNAGVKAGESGVDDSEGASPDGGDSSSSTLDGADSPVWINGSYLTCAWGGVDDDSTQVDVLCQMHVDDGSLASSEQLSVVGGEWIATDSSGQIRDDVIAAPGDSLSEQKFTMAFDEVQHLVITLAYKEAGSDEHSGMKVPFSDALPEATKGSDVAKCAKSKTLKACFEAANIEFAMPGKPQSQPKQSSRPERLPGKGKPASNAGKPD